MRKKRNRPEDIVHEAVAKFLDVSLAYPAFYTTFPAGGGGAVRGARLKALGMKAGFPDLLIIHAGRVFGIELKAAKGTAQPNQRALHAILADAGCAVMVCRSVVEVEMTLRHWSIPVKGRVAA